MMSSLLFFKQKTAYDMRISDCSSDVCSSDLIEDVIMGCALPEGSTGGNIARHSLLRAGFDTSFPGVTVNRACSSSLQAIAFAAQRIRSGEADLIVAGGVESVSLVQDKRNIHRFRRSEEHTSELQSLMRISYAVFCLKKKKQIIHKYKRLYNSYTS